MSLKQEIADLFAELERIDVEEYLKTGNVELSPRLFNIFSQIEDFDIDEQLEIIEELRNTDQEQFFISELRKIVLECFDKTSVAIKYKDEIYLHDNKDAEKRMENYYGDNDEDLRVDWKDFQEDKVEYWVYSSYKYRHGLRSEDLNENFKEDLEEYLKRGYDSIDPKDFVLVENEYVKFVNNNEEPNKDIRGSSNADFLWQKVVEHKGKLTLEKFMEYIFRLKSHKFDKWYELYDTFNWEQYSFAMSNGTRQDGIQVEVVLDYGS